MMPHSHGHGLVKGIVAAIRHWERTIRPPAPESGYSSKRSPALNTIYLGCFVDLPSHKRYDSNIKQNTQRTLDRGTRLCAMRCQNCYGLHVTPTFKLQRNIMYFSEFNAAYLATYRTLYLGPLRCAVLHAVYTAQYVLYRAGRSPLSPLAWSRTGVLRAPRSNTCKCKSSLGHKLLFSAIGERFVESVEQWLHLSRDKLTP